VILGILATQKVAGKHAAALKALATAVDTVYGCHITIDATGRHRRRAGRRGRAEAADRAVPYEAR
jgi:hypothetical protein